MNSKTSYHHGDLRSSLIDAAVHMLQEDGRAGLSMRKLADKVGVSRTAPYHHFADKQQLLCAIAQQGFEKQTAYLREPESDQVLPFAQRMRRFVQGYLTFALDNPQYYDLMFGAVIWKGEGIDDSFKEIAHGAFRQYVERIDTWQQQGHMNSEVSALRKAQITWSTMHGLARLMIDGIYVDKKAMLAMCDVATAMFLQQLGPVNNDED